MARLLDDDRYAVLAAGCPSSRWTGRAAGCRWCDATIGLGEIWCGHRCEDRFLRDHCWDHAREAALVRDGGRCVRCQLGPETLTLAKLLLRAWVPMGVVEAAGLWRTAEWRLLVQASQLEVNHVVPRRGGGYAAGCHHHLAGLETLCHRCHAGVTARQLQAWRTGGMAEAG